MMRFLLSALLLPLVLLPLLGCGKGSDTDDVQTVEIGQYQGQKLGSVEDFRENSIKGVQRIDLKEYHLTVDGLVEKPLKLAYAELQKLDRIKKVVILRCVEGWAVRALWEGIPLREIFHLAQPQPRANTVIFYAVDGYNTSLPLDYIMERNIIIADRLNGIRLPAEQGFPFQLVAEDKWGYKWARWITRIELSDDPDYRGYWESRGYNNQGDLDGPMRED